ncbi:MAG: hypothetical protein NTY48_06720 [Candidatus Diapherotrites archaeon]|nr:hypothetical protein [Candidatus Diapherotrites archaeon]
MLKHFSKKPRKVAFVDEKLKIAFERLGIGSSDEKELYFLINRALDDLTEDLSKFVKIPHNRWPNVYVRNYGITNLWKYDLSNGWRLIYTITADGVLILTIILEWFNHKEYERRFGY